MIWKLLSAFAGGVVASVASRIALNALQKSEIAKDVAEAIEFVRAKRRGDGEKASQDSEGA